MPEARLSPTLYHLFTRCKGTAKNRHQIFCIVLCGNRPTLPVALGSIVGEAEELAVFLGGGTAVAPGLHMVGIHLLLAP